MSSNGRRSGRVLATFASLLVVSLFLLSAVAGPALAHTGDDGSHHHDGWMGSHDGMGGWGFGGFGFLWMLLWALALIAVPAGIVYLAIGRHETTETADGDDALDLLRRRYAQGEIDDEEFESRRDRLLTERD